MFDIFGYSIFVHFNFLVFFMLKFLYFFLEHVFFFLVLSFEKFFHLTFLLLLKVHFSFNILTLMRHFSQFRFCLHELFGCLNISAMLEIHKRIQATFLFSLLCILVFGTSIYIRVFFAVTLQVFELLFLFVHRLLERFLDILFLPMELYFSLQLNVHDLNYLA